MKESHWKPLLLTAVVFGLVLAACEAAEEPPVGLVQATPEEPQVDVDGPDEGVFMTSSYELVPGMIVRVHTTAGDELRLRAEPGFEAEIMMTFPNGEIVELLEGPEPADGHLWWLIQDMGGLREGWSAEAADDINTLVPLPILNVLDGTVMVNGSRLSESALLDFGDEVFVEPGSLAEIIWDAGSLTTLDEGSEVQVVDMGEVDPHAEGRSSGFMRPARRHWLLHGLFARRGESTTRVSRPRGLPKIFRMLFTRERMVQAQGTEFSVSIPDPEAEIRVFVAEGQVEVATVVGGQTFTRFVGEGEGARLPVGEPPEPLEVEEVPEPVGSISGVVWEDTQGDGVVDSGEPRLQGVLVELLDSACEATFIATETDRNGAYSFGSLRPDVYCVRVELDTLPFAQYGWGSTSPDFPPDVPPVQNVDVFPEEDSSGVNFGFQRLFE